MEKYMTYDLMQHAFNELNGTTDTMNDESFIGINSAVTYPFFYDFDKLWNNTIGGTSSTAVMADDFQKHKFVGVKVPDYKSLYSHRYGITPKGNMPWLVVNASDFTNDNSYLRCKIHSAQNGDYFTAPTMYGFNGENSNVPASEVCGFYRGTNYGASAGYVPFVMRLLGSNFGLKIPLPDSHYLFRPPFTLIITVDAINTLSNTMSIPSVGFTSSTNADFSASSDGTSYRSLLGNYAGAGSGHARIDEGFWVKGYLDSSEWNLVGASFVNYYDESGTVPLGSFLAVSAFNSLGSIGSRNKYNCQVSTYAADLPNGQSNYLLSTFMNANEEVTGSATYMYLGALQYGFKKLILLPYAVQITDLMKYLYLVA